MRLRNLKNKIKYSALAMAGTIPFLSVSISSVSAASNAYPTNIDDYETWLTTASEQDISAFNEALMEAKQNGLVRTDFLSEHGYATQEELKEALQSLYDSATSGDIGAQESFNTLYNSYQNEFLLQASMKLSGEEISYMPIEAIQTASSEVFNQFPKLAFIAIGVGVAAVVGIAIYKKTKNKAKSKENIMKEKV